jgi:type VI secretion system protein ImpM
MSAEAGGGPPGWHGKLSTLGDFASRRLPAPALQALDRWLSDVVAGSRQQLGDDWLERYLDSPLQRFAIGPEVLDGAWWFGALMPSCDNVGRYFPLVVLQPRPAPPVDRDGLDHLDRWWRGVGEAALETLSDEVDVERFDRALAALAPWPPWSPSPGQPAVPASACFDDQASSRGPGLIFPPPGCTPAELVQGWALAEWTRRLRGHSLWWSWRPQASPSTCRIVAGLPSAEVFASMLGPAA